MCESMLQNLQELANRLNNLGDRMNAHVKELEEKLREMKVGVHAAVQGNDDMIVAYERFKGTFTITVTTKPTEVHAPTTKPWRECNREVKAQAYDMLEELVSELVRQTQLRIDRITNK